MFESRTVDLRVPFVGRGHELNRLLAILKRGAFVTLVGPGGVGKSRLAVEALKRLHPDDGREICAVTFAGISPEAALGTLMQALAVKEEPGEPPLQTLRAALASRPLVLLLDNCEQTPDEASAAIEALAGIPTLTIVATSQRRLDYPDELVFDVEPLTVDESVRFFAARAQLEPSALHGVVEETIAAIARALDGLPVAIDLAAARLASLSLDQLADELRTLRPYHLRSTRGSEPRHRTIGNVIAWSHSQLGPQAKRCFALASLFTDEFDAADIARVGDDDPALVGRALHEAAALSLLIQTEFGYRMLSPIRAVAARAFAALTNRRAIEERFAVRMNEVARALWSEIAGANAGAAMYRLFLRYGDFCNAMTWALKRPTERFSALSDVLPIMIAAWADGGRFTEGLLWAERLESVAERMKPQMRGTMYYVGICVSHAAGDYGRMLDRANATLSAFTIAGDRLGLARSYNALAAAAFHCGLVDDAWEYAGTAAEIYGQIDHHRGVAAALINQGNVLFEGRDDAARARIHFRRALDILQERGTDTLLGVVYGNLAEVDYSVKEYDGCVAYAHEALARFEAAANLAHIAWQHQTLARVSIAQALAPAAKEHLHLACDLLRRAPQPAWIARLGELVARLLCFVGQHQEAALALAAAGRLRRERSLHAMGFIGSERRLDEERVRGALGEQAVFDAETRAAAWDTAHLTAYFATLLVGIGRSEPWRRPVIVPERNAAGVEQEQT